MQHATPSIPSPTRPTKRRDLRRGTYSHGRHHQLHQSLEAFGNGCSVGDRASFRFHDPDLTWLSAPIDIWRTARFLLKLLEDDTPAFASRRISELTVQGDQAGANIWSEVMAAIAVLRMSEPPDSNPRD